jgi:hypothetical protein
VVVVVVEVVVVTVIVEVVLIAIVAVPEGLMLAALGLVAKSILAPPPCVNPLSKDLSKCLEKYLDKAFGPENTAKLCKDALEDMSQSNQKAKMITDTYFPTDWADTNERHGT